MIYIYFNIYNYTSMGDSQQNMLVFINRRKQKKKKLPQDFII